VDTRLGKGSTIIDPNLASLEGQTTAPARITTNLLIRGDS